MAVTITVYDGANTIGGKKVLLGDGDTAVSLDFGTSFHPRFQYFEEFLVPKVSVPIYLRPLSECPTLIDKHIYESDVWNAVVIAHVWYLSGAGTT